MCLFVFTETIIFIFFFIDLPAAILFECVQTIYTIYPKSDLLEKAAKCIGKFVLSPKINLKYLGKFSRLSQPCVFDAECLCFQLAFFAVTFLSRIKGPNICCPAGSCPSTAAPNDNN